MGVMVIMRIDEAIAHCLEVAERKKESIAEYEQNPIHYEKEIRYCKECASEHRQFAEWLRELKGYKKAYTEIDSKIECDYMGNNEYEMAVSDGYQGAINIIDRCIEEVNADDNN